MTIRQPVLLDDTLQEAARLSPVKLSLHEQLVPLSTADMILPPEALEIPLRSLIRLYDEHGSVGIYRVREIRNTVNRTRTLALEHSLCTLRDSVIPAQGFMGSVRECLQRLLDCQSVPLWTLGDTETPDDLTLIFATGYANLLDALQNLLSMLPEGYMLDFDQSTAPWLLHLRRLPEEAFCEGRLSRNLHSVRIDTDASRLCTRVYPFGVEVEESRISLVPLTGSDYLDAANASNVISRTFENDLIFDVPTLQEVAQRYLNRHALPETTVTVSAADLSAATCEELDHFRPGRMCRLCLPGLGQPLSERIIVMDRPDVYGAPGQVLLTLSNRLKPQSDAAEIDELVHLTTAGKLLGGTVTKAVDSNRAHGTYHAPVVHYFDIADWAAVLDVRIAFKADSGAVVRDVRLDGASPQDDVWKGGSFSAMPYLRRDELGQIARGEHWVSFLPYGSSAEDSVGVSSTVTLTVIEKTTR